jgi:hypothetical protein
VTELRDRHPTVPEVGRAVVLPGRQYDPGKPVLAAVSEVLLARGWAVREVWWQVPDGLDGRRATKWVADQARTAADGWAERPLLVGKSLGTRATAYAARQRLDAVWLTPLLLEKAVVRGMRRSRARQLLVGGTADRLAWDAAVARSLDAEVLELPDADHGLVVTGDPSRTTAYRDRLRAAVAAWLPGLGSG